MKLLFMTMLNSSHLIWFISMKLPPPIDALISFIGTVMTVPNKLPPSFLIAFLAFVLVFIALSL